MLKTGWWRYYVSQSYLASIGINSTLGGYMRDPVTGDWKFDSDKMWSSFQAGLLQGVTSIGINYATQELGLNPLLANIGFSAISTAIKGK